jgi:Tol biopolymer transport system component
MSARRLLSTVIGAFGASLVVVALASAIASAAPVVEGESVVDVGITGATLTANIHPMSFTTNFHFEYGTSTSYGTSVPIPDAHIGGGTVNQVVSRILSGLQPATTYHFRVIATSMDGTTTGPDSTFRTYAPEDQAAETCANVDIRGVQFSSFLPDCRAYELVSPAGKQGANIASITGSTQSSIDGDAVKYDSEAAFGDARGIEQQGAEYVSQRSEAGWSTNSINPEQESIGLSIYVSSEYQDLSDDLSKGVFFALSPVTSGSPDVEHVANLYARTDILTGGLGSYELLSDCPACEGTPLPPRPVGLQAPMIAVAGASADFTHIVFESVSNLTPGTKGISTDIPKLYEWHGGSLRLVGILPDGEPASGSSAGQGAGGGMGTAADWTESTISTDGSRIVFTSEANWSERSNGKDLSGNLYMRDNGTETVQLNASERTAPDPQGQQPATFWAATADDSKVYFTSKQLLTDDATGESQAAENIYQYDVNASEGKHLTLIAVDDEAGSGGVGSEGDAVVGVSGDGSYVYFIGKDPSVGGQRVGSYSSHGLFVWHDGTVRYVASHEDLAYPFNGTYWGEDGRASDKNFRVTSDGTIAVFTSRDPGTAAQVGYNNVHGRGGICHIGKIEGETCDEVYVYSYISDKIRCASCDSTGAMPVSDAGFSAILSFDAAYAYGGNGDQTQQYLSNAVSGDGKYVFFDTGDALVSGDINSHRDVYEYDTVTGEVRLISGGTCDCESSFADASPDGSNVFFTTPQQLVKRDGDTNNDLYDARVNGGIASQNVVPALPCEGDDCQGPVGSAPAFSLPSSSTFAGSGNMPPEPRPSSVIAKKRSLTTVQKLARAIATCKKKPRTKRAVCEAHARKKYRVKKAKKASRHASRRVGR